MSEYTPLFAAQISALILSAAFAAAFFLSPRFASGRRFLFVLFAAGTLMRLALAWTTPGNYDMRFWEEVAGISGRNGNIYVETDLYQYSPLWFWLLGILKKAQETLGGLPFKPLVCTLLTLVDIATLSLLVLIARSRKIPAALPASFFYLNPVSFLLTGYHGQIENLAAFLLLIGVWRGTPYVLWAFSTLGFMVKHSIFYEMLIAVRYSFKPRLQAAFFALSCLAFLALFIPFWKEGGEGILQNVFMYSSYPRDYGLSTFFRAEWLKYAFIAALFIYPFALRSKDLVQRLLLGMLFFLVFTTGFGNQYLVLPIALGALRPSKGFFFYSVAASLFLLGDPQNLDIRWLSWVPLNLVWASAAYWWVTEQFTSSLEARVIDVSRGSLGKSK